MGIFVDWKDQFATGRTHDTPATFTDADGAYACKGYIVQHIYKGGLGDLLRCYVKHCQGPWWKKWPVIWRNDEQRMREILNQIVLDWTE